jgi:hypothetical protein
MRGVQTGQHARGVFLVLRVRNLQLLEKFSAGGCGVAFREK